MSTDDLIEKNGQTDLIQSDDSVGIATLFALVTYLTLPYLRGGQALTPAQR